MNIFKQLWLSLYSPKDIAKYRFQGIGKSILYVFLLVFISTIPAFVYTSLDIHNGLTSFEKAVQNELPSFRIADGKLTTHATAPIIYNDEDFTVIVDGTGEMTISDVQLQDDQALALLQTQFVLITNGLVQTQPYELFEGFVITLEDIQGFLSQMDGMFAIFLTIIGVVTYLLAAGLLFFEISLLALFATLLFNVARKNLKYRHMWILTAYSVTLSTVFFTIMSAFKTTVIGGSFINWAVSLIILYLVLKEIPVPTTTKKLDNE